MGEKRGKENGVKGGEAKREERGWRVEKLRVKEGIMFERGGDLGGLLGML